MLTECQIDFKNNIVELNQFSINQEKFAYKISEKETKESRILWPELCEL